MTLEQLVDDYLIKHDAAIEADRAREAMRKAGTCDCRLEQLTATLVVAHNARTAAFRALRAARKR